MVSWKKGLRSAIRAWQSATGAEATGYLKKVQLAALKEAIARNFGGMAALG